MENYTLIQKLEKAIARTDCDARMETQLVLAMEKGISIDDFMVSCDSIFYREYNKDVVFTDIKEDARKQAVLQLHLSRTGISDHLPEGVFYQPAELSPKFSDASDMALDYKRNKQKESSVRRFFLPFENDFFWQRMQVESGEGELLEGLQSGIINDYFIRFWGLSPLIPKTLLVPLILLLPHANKIAGDLHLTGKCLEYLLHEPVRIEKITAPVTDTRSLFNQPLGKQQLGIDMICGEEFFEDYPQLRVSIGPLKYSNISDYLENGNRFEFLSTFYNFFIPAGADVQTHIEVPSEKRGMHFLTDDEPILGYSSVLPAFVVNNERNQINLTA